MAGFLASTSPVPARITMALDLRGMYGPQVDAALGVLEPTVDLWESGALTPTRAQMERLGLLTGFPVAFFYLPVTDHYIQSLCANVPNGCTCTCHHNGQGALL